MILWLVACGPGPLSIETRSLPEARVGERYDVRIDVAGGRKVTFAAAGLPSGLALHPDRGVLSGTPTTATTSTLDVTATSRDGTQAIRSFELVVGGAQRGCGERFEGTFTAAAGNGADLDWDVSEGWASRTMILPGPQIHRVDLRTAGDADLALYLIEPGQALVPGTRLDTQAEAILPREQVEGAPLAIGWNTVPNLGAHLAVGSDPTLLVVANAPGSWSITTECLPGPLFESTVLGPFRRGDEVRAGFRATRGEQGLLVEALDPLPDGLGMTTGGAVIGVASVAGMHPVRLRASNADGFTTEVGAAIGIHEPLRPACGETVALPDTVLDVTLRDVRRLVSLEADWANHVALRWTIETEAPARVLAVPPTQGLFADPQADVETVEGPVVVDQAPNSWPDAAYWQRWPQSRLVVSGTVNGAVTLECDDGPRLDAAALPVLEPGGGRTLPVAGGTPPFTWSAQDLPASVKLLPDGTFVTDGTDFGEALVTVRVVDAEGESWSTTEPLFASSQAACGDAVPVLRCGDDVADLPREPDLPTACIGAADVLAWDWVVIGARGLTRDEFAAFPPAGGDPFPLVSRRAWALTRGGIGLNDALEPYDGRPFLFAQVSEDEAPFCVRCGEGVRPLDALDDCPE
ncbi:MAG: putative Ig domain-containing protein [Myxococcota bacterium]